MIKNAKNNRGPIGKGGPIQFWGWVFIDISLYEDYRKIVFNF